MTMQTQNRLIQPFHPIQPSHSSLRMAAKTGLFTLGFSLSLLTGAIAVHAQSTVPQPLSDFKNQDTLSDPFSDRGGGQVNSVFNLIHRAVQGSLKSPDEFNSQQRENLDEATADFRARQLERIRSQPKPAPEPASGLAPANEPQ